MALFGHSVRHYGVQNLGHLPYYKKKNPTIFVVLLFRIEHDGKGFAAGWHLSKVW